MVKAIALTDWQKLFAEFYTKKVRTEIWGYSSDEHLEKGFNFEKYGEFVLLPGYPCLSDHLEKPDLEFAESKKKT